MKPSDEKEKSKEEKPKEGAEPAKPEEPKKDEKKEEPKKDDKKDEKPKPVLIDFDGLESRVARVPVEAGNYSSLAANKENLFTEGRPASLAARAT